MRKTKIVCTIGPASQSEEIVDQLIDAGMNVARLNFSHGTHESHKKSFDMVKAISERKGQPIATLLDTKGPEVRIRTFRDSKVQIEAGQRFTLTTDEIVGSADRVSITYGGLTDDIKVGATILLDDGLVELRVLEVSGNDVVCEAMNGGPMSDNKGVNFPGVSIRLPYISEKDRGDILFGIEAGFDFIAASFARNADDILEIRQILHDNGADGIKIIAKIENAEGVENIDDILRVSDGIMVARGDMGVEISLEELPAIQKALIQKAYNTGKIVITATQLLDSMQKNPRPTRAEVTDVANAIYDGTSAIMLSGETANGLYPVRSVETMARIAYRTEKEINYRARFLAKQEYSIEKTNVTTAISHATCTTAYDLGASAIVVVTMTGNSANRISKYKPSIPIIGCTSSERTYRQMAISWGVTPMMIEDEDDIDVLFVKAVECSIRCGVVSEGDLVVIAAGVPLGLTGSTNLLKVQVAGNVLAVGRGVGDATVSGRLCVAQNGQDASRDFMGKDILVIPKTDNGMMPILRNAIAIVTEEDGLSSHAAITGLALNIPVIVGASGATFLLKSGTIATIDASRGIIRNSSAGYK
ncbi:MAG: pyruvate kinase [Oscillospiraceae bacterium]|nr:pyruvate kinase [Oscillospiraceae bacterium]